MTRRVYCALKHVIVVTLFPTLAIAFRTWLRALDCVSFSVTDDKPSSTEDAPHTLTSRRETEITFRHSDCRSFLTKKVEIDPNDRPSIEKRCLLCSTSLSDVVKDRVSVLLSCTSYTSINSLYYNSLFATLFQPSYHDPDTCGVAPSAPSTPAWYMLSQQYTHPIADVQSSR